MLGIGHYNESRVGSSFEKVCKVFQQKVSKSEELKQHMFGVKALHKSVLDNVLDALCDDSKIIKEQLAEAERLSATQTLLHASI
jgi:hypothetical protein